MKKVVLGALAGVGAALVIYKLAKQGKLDGLYDDMDKFADKAKRQIKDTIDLGKNQAEYLKDRLATKGQEVNNMVEDIEHRVLEKLNNAKS